MRSRHFQFPYLHLPLSSTSPSRWTLRTDEKAFVKSIVMHIIPAEFPVYGLSSTSLEKAASKSIITNTSTAARNKYKLRWNTWKSFTCNTTYITFQHMKDDAKANKESRLKQREQMNFAQYEAHVRYSFHSWGGIKKEEVQPTANLTVKRWKATRQNKIE